MGNFRSQKLRKAVLERDNFTCQKCKLEDKTGRLLEAHHIIPLAFGGKEELENLITFCLDCHHYAPNTQEEFKEYFSEEMTGTLTIFTKAWKKARKEHPELFKDSLNFPD